MICSRNDANSIHFSGCGKAENGKGCSKVRSSVFGKLRSNKALTFDPSGSGATCFSRRKANIKMASKQCKHALSGLIAKLASFLFFINVSLPCYLRPTNMIAR